jgi:hypothetical protein
MRFMVIMYPGPEAEAGIMPNEKLLTDMMKYNEELVKAGVMLSGEGLQPTSKAVRVRFPGGKPVVTDGPFTETKEVMGGFWMFNVKSKEEAIDWVKKCPCAGSEMIEIRQVFEAEDFGEAFTPELREQEERLRKQAQEQSR